VSGIEPVGEFFNPEKKEPAEKQMSKKPYKILVNPQEIERQSMEIISQQLGDRSFNPHEEQIIKRIIHATADFDFADITVISPEAIPKARLALEGGCLICTDTRMIAAGINRGLLHRFGARVECFVDSEEVKTMAAAEGITRSMANIRLCARVNKEGIYLIGNAPTALMELLALHEAGAIRPALVIGVPVGFVGAQEAKEELMKSKLPYITTKGRKGGSVVAVAALHALLHLLQP